MWKWTASWCRPSSGLSKPAKISSRIEKYPPLSSLFSLVLWGHVLTSICRYIPKNHFSKDTILPQPKASLPCGFWTTFQTSKGRFVKNHSGKKILTTICWKDLKLLNFWKGEKSNKMPSSIGRGSRESKTCWKNIVWCTKRSPWWPITTQLSTSAPWTTNKTGCPSTTWISKTACPTTLGSPTSSQSKKLNQTPDFNPVLNSLFFILSNFNKPFEYYLLCIRKFFPNSLICYYFQQMIYDEFLIWLAWDVLGL